MRFRSGFASTCMSLVRLPSLGVGGIRVYEFVSEVRKVDFGRNDLSNRVLDQADLVP
jgi:hypothetical protein